MTPRTRTRGDIERAVRSGWSVETCDKVDVDDWSAGNPARGQCRATALTSRQGYRRLNRLAGGAEIDLTLEQFAATEIVQQSHVVERHVGPPGRCAEQYLLLRARVFEALGDSAATFPR